MFRCEYCHTELVEHRPNCPNCGAAIRASVKVARAQNLTTGVAPLAELCLPLDDEEHFYFDDSIDEKRMKTVRERFNIPANEKIWLVYDGTILGSNREGFAICEKGLYWRNSWTTESKRTFLPWPEFAKRAINIISMEIKLGRGDNIGFATGSDEELDKKVLALFKSIQNSLNGK
jgi:hypothetical protein